MQKTTSNMKLIDTGVQKLSATHGCMPKQSKMFDWNLSKFNEKLKLDKKVMFEVKVKFGENTLLASCIMYTSNENGRTNVLCKTNPNFTVR